MALLPGPCGIRLGARGRRHIDSASKQKGLSRQSPEEAFFPVLRAVVQAMTRSATISVPLVSGPSSSATTKFASPNMAPINIGIAKPRFQDGLLAKKVRIGGTSPPAIAPTW